MSIDLGDMPALTASFAPFTPEQPKPTADQPFPSRPGPSVDPGLTRWAPNANRQRLTSLLDDIERLLERPAVS